MKFLYLFFCTFLLISCSPDHTEIKSDIKAVLDAQANAWNEGDIDQFMEGYWKSDSLVFISSRGTSLGWDAALEGYKKGYPDRETMGTLSFEVVQLDVLHHEAAFMIGKWHLNRDQPIGGYFTLLWKKIDGLWVIVSDHTS